MNPDRLPAFLRDISQKARLAGAVAGELLRHPFSTSFIFYDRYTGGIKALPVRNTALERRRDRLVRSALGVAAIGAVAGGVAVWNLWEGKFNFDREFANSQQGQVATLEEFADREREFLTTRGVEILARTKDKNTLPNTAGLIAGLAAFALIVGSRLVSLKPPHLPDSFWQLPRPQDPNGLVLKALLEEREDGS